MTEKIVNTLITLGLGSQITIIDLAPCYKGVGLPLDIKGVKILRPTKLYAPRLMGKNCSEVWKFAKLNADHIKPLLEQYISNPTPILVVNDITIYLHAGDPMLLYKAIDKSILFIGNAYYGIKLKDECGLWEKEKLLVEELSRRVDIVWRL